MLITTSYKFKIVSQIDKFNNEISLNKKVLQDTIAIFRDALSFCIEVCETEYQNYESLKSKERINYIEKCIHNKKYNTAIYDFDTKFYKFPSYLRRNVISEAIGIVNTYHTNYEKWETEGKNGNPPTLNKHHFKMPTFYKLVMSNKLQDNMIQLKVYCHNDWVWMTVKLKGNDVSYFRKYLQNKTESSPSLRKVDKNYYLVFSYEDNVSLIKKVPLDYKIVAVDLGLNHHATMSVMDKSGTVYACKFVNIAYEKDQLNHTLNKIKGFQQKGITNQRLWRKVVYLNNEISRKTSHKIMEFALLHQADCIVFEHLDTNGKKSGSKKQQLHHWKCKQIQNMITLKAHQNGIRISTICAKNTSRLAFDGSGTVRRGEYYINKKKYTNYSICIFSSLKEYNCDLNATYNIGARFFLRCYHNLYNDVLVPTTERTLFTLKEYNKNLVYNT